MRTFLFALLFVIAACERMPLPFQSELQVGDSGSLVTIAQTLLSRCVPGPVAVTGKFDRATAAAVASFRAAQGLPATGGFDSLAAAHLLANCSADGVTWVPGTPAPPGYKYLVYVPVMRDRSIEVNATLFNAGGDPLHSFRVRTRGQSDSVTGEQLNQFTSNGVTPTGISQFDLNSPEDDPVDFGPYDVNRAVIGLKGNAALLLPNIRNGILMHTGEWPNWNPSLPMPNSHGCIHGHPEDIKLVAEILVSMGVVVRNNTDGKLPYPYKPQGILAVVLQD